MNNDNEFPCKEKLAFETIEAAKVAASVARYQRGISLKVYRCKYCGLWHLSSS